MQRIPFTFIWEIGMCLWTWKAKIDAVVVVVAAVALPGGVAFLLHFMRLRLELCVLFPTRLLSHTFRYTHVQARERERERENSVDNRAGNLTV